EVTAIDAFADRDQHSSVRAIAVPRPFSPDAAARAAQSIACDAVVYLSNFENHPDAVETLSAGRTLWGNPPGVLRRVRDPQRLARALRERGVNAPEVRLSPGRFARRWKRSEGGTPDTTLRKADCGPRIVAP